MTSCEGVRIPHGGTRRPGRVRRACHSVIVRRPSLDTASDPHRPVRERSPRPSWCRRRGRCWSRSASRWRPSPRPRCRPGRSPGRRRPRRDLSELRMHPYKTASRWPKVQDGHLDRAAFSRELETTRRGLVACIPSPGRSDDPSLPLSMTLLPNATSQPESSLAASIAASIKEKDTWPMGSRPPLILSPDTSRALARSSSSVVLTATRSLPIWGIVPTKRAYYKWRCIARVL